MTGLGKLKDPSGWKLEADFEVPDVVKARNGVGFLLRNLSHEGYQFARDVRIERIFLQDAHLFPNEESFSLASSGMTNTTAPHEATPPTTDPRGFYAPKWSLAADYERTNVFGEADQAIQLEQRFLFTARGKTPAHEPSGTVHAARMYPLLTIRIPPAPLADFENAIRRIRVDYRIEFALDGMAPKKRRSIPPMGHLGGPTVGMIIEEQQASGQVGPNQAGIWRDLTTAPAGISVKGIFAAAEKPLVWEVIAQGIRDGQPDDWDNVHQWPKLAGNKQPDTPGLPHGLHHHWRWFPEAARPGALAKVLLGGTGPQFAGISGPGSAMIDPLLAKQSMRFAVGRFDLIPGVEAAYPTNGFDGFDELFVNHPLRKKGPVKIEDGADLVMWFSFTIEREDVVGQKGPAPLPSFDGTLFVHGVFFAHETLKVTTFPSFKPRGSNAKQYLPRRPTHRWVR